jgi:hypothetical protein
MSEHDFEPIRGLPGNLPAGETILWQDAPNSLIMAQEAFHIRAVAAYFGLMLAWRTATAISGGAAPIKALENALWVTPLALAALAMLGFLAWLNSRTTVYTITNRRVVMRFGAAIPKAINIPFGIIESAAMKPLPKGAGDLALTLKAPNKIAFTHLWPHARPWRFSAPQPTFRGLRDVSEAAKILAAAMEQHAPNVVLANLAAPVRETASKPGLARPEIAAA